MMEDAAPTADPPRATPVVSPHQANWHQRLLARFIWLSLRCLTATLRFRAVDNSGLINNPPPGQRCIFATWHNRLSVAIAIHVKLIRRHAPDRRLATIASASRDGALIARILQLYGVEPMRGSSSRRGGQALLEFARAARRGFDLAITPDGPRGPCYAAQEGVLVAAQITGLPLVAVGCHLHRKVSLRSWDRFQIPLPFSRCDVVFDKPLTVPRELTTAQRAELRVELERRLRALNRD